MLLGSPAKQGDEGATPRAKAGENPYLIDERGKLMRSRATRRIRYLCETYGLDWLRLQRLHDIGLAAVRDLDDEQLLGLTYDMEMAASAARCGVDPTQLFERFL
jgi:hypothetical protein